MLLLDKKYECHCEVGTFCCVQIKNSKGEAADIVKMTFSRDTGLLLAAASAWALFLKIKWSPFPSLNCNPSIANT